MPIFIKNIKPIFTGKVRLGSTSLAPQFLNSTILATVQETMPVDITLVTNQQDVTFSSSNLPTGFVLNPTTGKLTNSRTAIVAAAGAVQNILIRATNSKGQYSESTFSVRVNGAAEGDVYDFPQAHVLDASYLDVSANYLSARYPRLVSKFGNKTITARSAVSSAGTDTTLLNSNDADNSFLGERVCVSKDGKTVIAHRSVYFSNQFVAGGSGGFQVIDYTVPTAPVVRQTVQGPSLSGMGSYGLETDDTAGVVVALGYNGNNTTNNASIYIKRNGQFELATSYNYAGANSSRAGTVSGNGSRVALAEADFKLGIYTAANGVVTKTHTITVGSETRSTSFTQDGNTLVVSAATTLNSTGVTTSVYQLINNVWVKHSFQTNTSVLAAISGDGKTIVNAGGGGNNAESPSYVYEYDGSTWVLTYTGTNASGPQQGAPNQLRVNSTGTVYVLTKYYSGANNILKIFAKSPSGVWNSIETQQGAITNGQYGISIAMANDGDTLYVGQSLTAAGGRNRGAVTRLPLNYASETLQYVNLPASAAGKRTAVKIRPNVVPLWNTPAGSLGSFNKNAFQGVQLSAVDPDGAVTYSVVSGSLPQGITLTSGGLISGSSTVTADTTASFTVRATGDAADSVDRAFALTITIPTIAATDAFATTLYKGNGSATKRTITTGIDLKNNGGLLWVKSRSTANSHSLFDTVRGANAPLFSNSNGEQVPSVDSSFKQEFNDNGFSFATTLSEVNQNTQDYAAWSFRKSAKFLDIVKFTGNGSYNVVNHSLGQSPGMIIFKSYSNPGDWIVWHRAFNFQKLLYLNTNDALVGTGTWLQAQGTTNFNLQFALANQSGQPMVAYLFGHDASANGIINCGSYTRNAGEEVTVNLGWTPRFLLMKGTQNTANDWIIVDSTRGDPYYLTSNRTDKEVSNPYAQFTATGFKTSYGAYTDQVVFMAIR